MWFRGLSYSFPSRVGHETDIAESILRCDKFVCNVQALVERRCGSHSCPDFSCDAHGVVFLECCITVPFRLRYECWPTPAISIRESVGHDHIHFHVPPVSLQRLCFQRPCNRLRVATGPRIEIDGQGPLAGAFRLISIIIYLHPKPLEVPARSEVLASLMLRRLVLCITMFDVPSHVVYTELHGDIVISFYL